MTRGEMGTNVTDNGLAIVTSPTLDPLTDELARRLSAVPPDPFATDVVVVPNIGVRDWLQRELSTRLDGGRAGIVANIRFLFVQQFLDTVFASSESPRGGAAIASWDIEHLTWIVHRAIDRIGRSSIPGATTKPLTAARVIADLFDRYGVHRPSMLRYWRMGRPVDAVEPVRDLPEHLLWQQHLYAEVCRLVDAESPADRLAGLGEVIRNEGLAGTVPDRIAIFGFSNVNATLRSVLEAVASARRCDVYLLHPVRRAESSSTPIEDRLIARDHEPTSDVNNPLLDRWGRPSLETARVLGGRWKDLDPTPTEPRTDLDRLRRTIIEDRALDLAPISETSSQLSSSDGSLQIHACHGRVRQVEVLRDALLHLLADDPTLTLSDISIQCPDLVAFAPLIPAIFRSGQTASDASVPPLDVSIADRVLTGENPYHDAFWALLAVAQSRCGVGEMSSLLASAPIRRRFDIDDEDLDRLFDWFEALNVRFGLDSEHRRRWGIPESIVTGTWDSSLDRLFMGLAMSATEPFEGPGGVVPHDDMSVTDGPTLARIVDFLTSLRSLASRLDSPHSVADWADIFSSVIDEFFDESDQRDFLCRDLLDACDRLRHDAQSAGIDRAETFAYDEISSILSDLVISSSTRPRFRSGAITVTELLPQQGVPYRVVALLGVNESMFSTGSVRGDDVLSLRPCVGDPMPSASGRLQLLNVVLAAKDSLIITCDGADINNNKTIPLPVPLQELLESVVAMRALGEVTGPARVFTRHPRQSFALPALTCGLFRSDRPFTFDPVALDLHRRRNLPADPILGVRISRPSNVDAENKVSCESLRKVLARPTDFFVHDVLGIRLPTSDAGTINDFVDFWPSSLEIARSGRELFDAVKRNQSPPRETVGRLLHQLTLGGSFPPGHLGRVAAQEIGAEVLAIVEALPEAALRSEHTRVVEFDSMSAPLMSSNDGAAIVLSGIVSDVVGFDLVRASFTRFREDLVLGPWIDLALVGYAQPEHPWSVRVVARGSKGEPETRSFALAGSDPDARRDAATRAIGVAMTVMSCMSRGRVPFLPKTSEKLSRSSVESARGAYEGEGEYSPSMQFLFGRVSWDDFIAEKPIDVDPDPGATSRAQMFAHYVWNAFQETTTPLDAPWGSV